MQPKCPCREHLNPISSLSSPLKVPRHRSRSTKCSQISNSQLISCCSLNCLLSWCRVWSLNLRMNWWGCTRKCFSKNRSLSSTWWWWETRPSRITNCDACCSRGWTTSRLDSMCSSTERASLMLVSPPTTTYLWTSRVHFRKLIMLLSLTDRSMASAKATLLTQKCLLTTSWYLNNQHCGCHKTTTFLFSLSLFQSSCPRPHRITTHTSGNLAQLNNQPHRTMTMFVLEKHQ